MPPLDERFWGPTPTRWQTFTAQVWQQWLRMKPLRPADIAWIVLATYVVAYDSLAKPDEMLSVGVDRYLVKHPVITYVIVGVTAGHLLNWWPKKLDPFHQVARLFGR